MSFETSFNLINSELSYLKKSLESELNISKQQCEEYLAELNRLRSEHCIAQQNWERSRSVSQQNIVDLENELMKISDSIPREKEFLECLPHIAFICNSDGEINYGNQVFYSFFDLENPDFGWFPFGKEALASALIRGSWAREIDLKSKNGEEIKTDAKLISWNKYSGDIGGFIGIAIDRTQLINSKKENQKLKQELDSVYRLLSADKRSGMNENRRKEYRCLIYGDPGSGKSALINVLLGENLLPEGIHTNVPVRCGRGAEKAIVAHYWNGERQSCFDNDATAECVEKLLAEDGLLWLEIRSPDAGIPYDIVLEEICEISGGAISKADAFIYISTIRNYPSFTSLDEIQCHLNEGAYGIFLISKIDLERDDYESGRIVYTVASKIESAIKQIKRILCKYPKIRSCDIMPISSRFRTNMNLIAWHLEEVISSYRATYNHSVEATPYSLPVKDSDLSGNQDIFTPMLSAFHEQEFQTEFIRFIKSVSGKPDYEITNCLFISPHRESVNKLIARLSHDVSYVYSLEGMENTWIANFENNRYTKISVPDSVLSDISFIIAPETFDMNENEWNTLLEQFTPVFVLELTGSIHGIKELLDVTFKSCIAAIKSKRFCIVSGEGLMIDSAEVVSKEINKWANCSVPIFIFENYDVIMRSDHS